MATLHPQPLPLNTYDPTTEAPFHDAYERCLMMETSAGTDTDTVMLARCLGYLIRELPNEARESVAQEIVDCSADFDQMSSLSRLHINHLIRPLRQSKGHTPVPSEHPSRPSFTSEAPESAPTNHEAAKKLALRRDNYRCVVTGWADASSLYSMEAADLQMYNLNQNSIRCTTNYCHIFPPSTDWRFDSTDSAEKKTYARSVWAIIESFRHFNVPSELDGEKIHHLGNGFTMEIELRMMFDYLDLWFEHVAGDTYTVRALKPNTVPFFYLPPNHAITFTSTDLRLPLPNSDYLRLHVAICRVAHLSGAARYLDLEDREIEKLGVLADDGSSADLLASRLMHVALMT